MLDYFKQVCTQPVLKKSGPSIPDNYCPISKLSLISKIVENVIATQLLKILEGNNLFDHFQSGFRKNQSTEKALLRVINYILMSVDSGQITVLILLALSAAFVTVDHTFLLNRLRNWVGKGGTALNWFSSYLLMPLGHIICHFTPVSYHRKSPTVLKISNLDSLHCCH